MEKTTTETTKPNMVQLHQNGLGASKKNTIVDACTGGYRSIRKAIAKQGDIEVKEKFMLKLIQLNEMFPVHQKFGTLGSEYETIYNTILSRYDFLNSVDFDIINERILINKFENKIYQLSAAGYLKCVEEYSIERTHVFQREAQKIYERIEKKKEKVTISENESGKKLLESVKVNLLEQEKKAIAEKEKRQNFLNPYYLFDEKFDIYWKSLIEKGEVVGSLGEQIDIHHSGWQFYNKKEKNEIKKNIFSKLFSDFYKTVGGNVLDFQSKYNDWEEFLKTKF